MEGSLVLGFVLFFCAVVVYFLPGLIADHRGRDSAGTIAVLNLLFGWTVLGWLVLLIVAFTGRSARERAQQDEQMAVMRAMLAAQQSGKTQADASPAAATPMEVAAPAAKAPQTPASGQASRTLDEKAASLLDGVAKRLGVEPHAFIVATLFLTVAIVGAVAMLGEMR